MDELNDFKIRFLRIVQHKGRTGKQINNLDETSLYFRCQSQKTLAMMFESAATGYKKSEEKVTLMTCNNVTGNIKLKPVMLDKSTNHRTFKSINKYLFPASAWMNIEIFINFWKKKTHPGKLF